MKFRVPLDIHEALIEHHYQRDPTGQVVPDAGIAKLAAAVQKTRENVHTLVAMSEALALDKTQTPEANALKLRDSALRLAEKTAAGLDEAKTQIEQEIATIEQNTAAPPPPQDQASAALEAEIRSRLAGMNDTDRDKAINESFGSGNITIVAAVLRGPAFLAGMQPTRQDMVRHRYRTLFHGEEYARRDRLKGALEATDRTGRTFIDLITQMTSGTAMSLAEANANNARTAAEAVAAAIAE